MLRSRFILTSVLTLSALAALGFLSPAEADEVFQGTFTPVIVSSTPVDATHVHSDVSVTGSATLLGNFQGPASFIVDTTNLTYTGETMWTGANGDTLNQSFDGQFVATTTPGLFDNVEQFTITGGTGLFVGATGSGVGGGQFDLNTGTSPAPIPFTGTVVLAVPEPDSLALGLCLCGSLCIMHRRRK